MSVPEAIFKARSCFSASPVAEAARRSTSNRPLKTEGTCFPSCEKGSTLSWDWPVVHDCLIKGLGMSSRVYMRLGIWKILCHLPTIAGHRVPVVGFLRTEWVLHGPPFSYATGMPSESVSKIRPRNIREKRREKNTVRGTRPPYRDNRDEHRARADTCVTVLWPKSTNLLWRRISLLSRRGSGGGG